MPEVNLLHLWKRPAETKIIGELILSYVELEYIFQILVGNAIQDDNTAFRLFYRLRGEAQKLLAADAIARPHLKRLNLLPSYSEAYSAITLCRKIRNNYAHSLWDDDEKLGLRFFDTETPAKKAEGEVFFPVRSVDLNLLHKQVEYFNYTQKILWHVAYEAEVLLGTREKNNWAKPRRVQPVKEHNRQEKPRSLKPRLVLRTPQARRTLYRRGKSSP